MRADVYLYYWYDASSKDKVDEVIEQTGSMLQLKPAKGIKVSLSTFLCRFLILLFNK